MSNYKFDTKMVHSGYTVEPTSKSVTPPLYLTNAYQFDNSLDAQEQFELKKPGSIYTRLENPTNDILEARIADLDGGVGALTFASGHAAIFNTMLNLASEGDEIVSSTAIYGGAINMLGVTLKRLGITVKFVDPDDLEAWEAAITDKTRALFFEVVGNPNANVADIEAICQIGHRHGVPVIADSTFTTPYLCRPIEFGADIVIHSATKFLGGHSTVMGGIVVDSGNFQYAGNPRFPLYNDPDPSYHGVVFASLGRAAFISRLRALVTRDLGACLSPFNAFLLLQGVETLSLRMQRHCENAQAVAEYLEKHPKVSWVNYAGLPSSKYYPLAQKYLPDGCCGVVSFGIKGGRKGAENFMKHLKLASIVTHVADAKTCVLHPASSTHRQMNDEELAAAGVGADLIRFSVGLENIEDILADVEQALTNV